MATKPSVTPRWAETAGGVPASNIATPTSGESDTGFTNGQVVVSSSKLNWFMRLCYDWILWLAGLDASVAPGVLCFSGTPSNTASTTGYLIASASSGATAAAGGPNGGIASVLCPAGLVVRGLTIFTSQTILGGSVTVSLYVNGVQSSVQIVLSAGTTLGVYSATVTTPFSAGAGNTLNVQVANGAGVTQSTGILQASLLYTLA